tara:strand:+ start:587 stop:781 length:195 start_codon:yes stop_codon:yes gene_type:complete
LPLDLGEMSYLELRMEEGKIVNERGRVLVRNVEGRVVEGRDREKREGVPADEVVWDRSRMPEEE